MQGLIDAAKHPPDDAPGLQAFLHNVVIRKLLEAVVPGVLCVFVLAHPPMLMFRHSCCARCAARVAAPKLLLRHFKDHTDLRENSPEERSNVRSSLPQVLFALCPLTPAFRLRLCVPASVCVSVYLLCYCAAVLCASTGLSVYLPVYTCYLPRPGPEDLPVAGALHPGGHDGEVRGAEPGPSGPGRRHALLPVPSACIR
eukprot:865058-Pelagomonas_calceolata.AAC.2